MIKPACFGLIFLFSTLLIPLVATQVSAVDFSYKGELRLRNLQKDLDKGLSDQKNITEMPVRASLNIVVNDQLNVVVSPQATKNYGEVIATGNDESSSSRNSSGDIFHGTVDLFEAYVNSKGKHFGYRVGRQQLNYGDNVVLGTRNWTNGGLAFDALRFFIPIGEMRLDLVYSKITEGSNLRETEDDGHLTFAYLTIKDKPTLKLDAYIINNNIKEVTETTSYGLRFKGRYNAMDLRTENILQEQNLTNKTAYSLNLETGYNIDRSNRLFLGHSRNSFSYDQLYTNRHFYNGIIDLIGRRNINNFNAGISGKLSDKFKFKFKTLFFSLNKIGVSAYNLSTATQITGNNLERSVGREYDFLVQYSKNEYESMALGYSYFDHGDYFVNLEKSQFLYLQYRLAI